MRPPIEEIRARVEKATDGPLNDFTLLVHARQDIPALLAYIEELERK